MYTGFFNRHSRFLYAFIHNFWRILVRSSQYSYIFILKVFVFFFNTLISSYSIVLINNSPTTTNSILLIPNYYNTAESKNQTCSIF